MNRLRAKIDYTLKHSVVISKSFRFAASIVIRVAGIFIRTDDRSVLFSAHARKYNDSPRAIYEYMRTDPRFKDFIFYWALDDINTVVPGQCIKVVPDTWRYFKVALRCKYWITCVNIERSLRFKKGKCVYLNTWHGIPIKTVGNMAVGRKDYDFSHIDFFCVSGDYEIPIYEEAFNISAPHLIKTGMPRNDTLYQTTDEEINEIKKRLKLDSGKKIILYAPTWRDSNDYGKSYSLKPPMDLKKWENKLGGDFILLFKVHPYTSVLLGVGFNDFVRDYASYSDINDLLKISDVLISDYSATIFDYSILERPIIAFAYDFEEYSKNRGFAIDIKNELPGGICISEDQVIDRLLNIDYSTEKELVKQFKRKYVIYGGQATEKCVNIVFKN